ncbi:trypsin-like peptidase domain-containing protein [Marinibacterium sp. SX1]|uniref:trypsin-like peptidase domain-containing protein n=1 Tax=Marinibacterium sp. SX1 TaxID=3388424 RepID=UPI003D17BA9B
MADNFLTKNRIELGQCLEFGDGLALDSHAALVEALKAKAGPEAARLFAEPLLSRGNNSAPPTVSWYADVEGSGQPFNRLDSAAQASVTALLSRQLAAVGPLIDDPDAGALVSAALHLRDPDDIWVVDGRPVLINWGMLPAGQARDAASRAQTYGRTLGRFLPLGSAPPLTSLEREERAAQRNAARRDTLAEDPAAETAAAGTGPAGDGAMPPPPPPVRRGVPRGAWIPLVLLLLLAGGVLAWLLVPGNRIFQHRAASLVSAEEAVVLAEKINQSAEERVEVLRAALAGAVCTGDGTLLMPDGVTIEGMMPPNDLDPDDRAGAVRDARAPSLLPPGAERAQAAGQAGLADTNALLAHIEERTAMVLVQGANGLATGTGFFVGPDLLVTNYHVIENAGDEGIYVTNAALASLKPAELLKALGPMAATGGDFALLRVPGASQPSFPIYSPSSSQRLQSVIAAGYPGDLLSTDQQFRALRSGNLDAVPDLAVTDGTISAEQRLEAGSGVIVHSAPISTGNSGGPLIDMCGRLIGVNTFVVQGPLRNLNFALSGPDLVRFLEGTAALPSVVTSACAPRVKRASVVTDGDDTAADDSATDDTAMDGATGIAPLGLPPLDLPATDQ